MKTIPLASAACLAAFPGSDPPRRGPLPAALSAGVIRLLRFLDLYWRAPAFGGVWYKSRQLKETICSPSEGWGWLAAFSGSGRNVGAVIRLAVGLCQQRAQCPLSQVNLT